MSRTLRFAAMLAVLGMSLAMLSRDLLCAEEAKPAAAEAKPKPAPIKVVILVGGHGYDEKNFHLAWGGHDDIVCEVYKDSKTPFSIFDDANSFKYDVILMYTLKSGINEKQRANCLKLLKKGVGLVVWHHALGNCQDWPDFERIAGGKFWMRPGARPDGTKVGRSGTGGGKLKMHIEDPNHPITKGMKDFEIGDETYNRQTFAKGIKVLVTTDHPKSDKQIAWVSNYPGARVFGYQTGHGAGSWRHPSFRRLMAQGIRWVAGRIGGTVAKPAEATKPAKP
jgi:type 1 glutamine amidotransferase